MKKILFLGDSITDARRSYQEDEHHYIGQGYTQIVGGKLALEHPGEYEFTNKGISGNRIVDLYARIKKDCWNLKPDYISILIGVNDVWHELEEEQNGVDVKRYDHIYRTLLDETLERLPNCKIMLMEPFSQPGYTMGHDEYNDTFRSETEKRAQVVRKIAADYGMVFVPLQEELDQVARETGYQVWTEDGVHPTLSGHALLARAWLKGFEQLK